MNGVKRIVTPLDAAEVQDAVGRAKGGEKGEDHEHIHLLTDPHFKFP
jgi:hypothetical protein